MGVTQMLLSRLPVLQFRGAGRVKGAERANRVSPGLSSEWERDLGVGQSWMPLSYGEYYPRSAPVYAAIKVRQDALAGVPLSPNPPKDTDGRREESGRGVRELQGK